MNQPKNGGEEKVIAQSGNQWNDRILCSDESCIGVIGKNNCCRVCGKPLENDGSTPLETEPIQSENDIKMEDPVSNDLELETNDHGQKAPEDNSDWENRRLCIDESCIGVIGPDGRCKECGKPIEPESPLSADHQQ